MARGIKDLNLLSQVHFSGEADCNEFKPHWLRPNFCVDCNKLFDKHKPELIPSDEILIKVQTVLMLITIVYYDHVGYCVFPKC